MPQRKPCMMVVALTLAISPGIACAQCYDWLDWIGVPGLDGPVYASILFDDGSGPALYVGGGFTVAGNARAHRIAKWDGAQWSEVGKGFDSSVWALAVYQGHLVAAGYFEHSADGSGTLNRIAIWNGGSWSPLGAGLNDAVLELTVADGLLIAGGAFSTAGTSDAQGVAAWNGNAWSAIGSGIVGSVFALTIYEGDLYAGGRFNGPPTNPSSNILRWNGIE